MLKIKDNVDLKELEKFGFKTKYDEDTGEIKKYLLMEKQQVLIQVIFAIKCCQKILYLFI